MHTYRSIQAINALTKIFPLYLVFAMAAACSQTAADKTVVAAAAPKNEDSELAEHRRIMAEQEKFQTRFLAMLPKLRVERLYSIDPRKDSESVAAKDQIQGYLIRSHGNVASEQSSSGVLQNSLRKMIESKPEYAAMCFDPHHVAVFSDGTEEFNAVVCFECGNYRIFSAKGDWLLSGSFNVHEEPIWDKAFSDAGLY